MVEDDAKARFQSLRRTSPLAADCLCVAACLPEANVPADFLRRGAPALGPVISEAFARAAGEEQVEEMLRPLNDTSLCERVVMYERFQGWRVEPGGVAAFKSSLDAAAQRAWAERVVRAADIVFREVRHGWVKYDDIALGCAELVKRWDFNFAEAGRPLMDAATALTFRSTGENEKEAGVYLRRALQIFEKNLPPDHLDLAAALYELGRHEHKYEKDDEQLSREALLRILRALEIRHKALPHTSPVYLDNVCTYAEAQLERGNASAAQAMVEFVSATVQQTPGAAPRLKSRSLHNRAWLLHLQGRHHDALGLANQALKLRQKLEVEEDDSVTEDDILHLGSAADTHQLLSDIHRALEQHEESGRHLARSLALSLDGIGIEPTELASWLVEYADRDDDRRLAFDARVGLYEEAIAFVGERLGNDHPSAVPAYMQLAKAHLVRGGYKEAEPYFRRMVKIAEKAERPEDGDLPLCLGLWGKALYLNGKYVEAEVQLEQALALLDKATAPSDLDILQILDVYVLVLKKQGRTSEAEAAKARADATAERVKAEMASRATENDEPPKEVQRFTSGDARLYHVGSAAATATSFIFKGIKIAFAIVVFYFFIRSC